MAGVVMGAARTRTVDPAVANVDCEWCVSLAGDPCKGGDTHNTRAVAYRKFLDKPRKAVLPYAGTSGHSGSETSESRARTEDAKGITVTRQQRTMTLLGFAGNKGLTVAELREVSGWHHGQASASLTNLHKGGLIARLAEKRGRCKVYVGLDYIRHRKVEKPGRNPSKGQRTFERGHLCPVDLHCVQDRLDHVWVRESATSPYWATPGGNSRAWGRLYFPLREVVLTRTVGEER